MTHMIRCWPGQTPTHAPHARLLTCTLPLWLTSSLTCFNSCFFLSSLVPLLIFLSGFLSRSLLPPLTSLSSERTSNSFYIFGPSRRAQSLSQAHPAPLAHGYHDDPCTLKKGGHRHSRKNVAEVKYGRASELAKEMCVNVSVVKTKKSSHKRGDLSFTLLNASHLKSH